MSERANSWCGESARHLPSPSLAGRFAAPLSDFARVTAAAGSRAGSADLRMANSTHSDLDLQHTIRPGLDILANEIIIALKKRTRFQRNAPIYEPGLVRSDPGISLLAYELGRIECCHAELGRYTFAAQEPFTDIAAVMPVIRREPPPSPIRPMASGVGERILAFYREWIDRACAHGSDPNSFGETVTADVGALLAIMERVNLGKLVAESKYSEMPERFVETGGDRDAILALIVRRDREAQVFELARTLAEHYQLAPEHAVGVFEFMIATTIDIEVEYLRMRIAGEHSPGRATPR